MTLPDFLVIADTYAEAHTPADKRRRRVPVTDDLLAAMRRLEAQDQA